ncbi:MAG TPA: hypothetical protein VFW49_15080 [Fluviicoccus sp.]|nr:hypothetical protein [Fluviicoccus sp.]
MDPITIAMALGQFAPSIIKLITGSDKAAEVADKVVDIAKTVTGTDTGEEALNAIQADPNKVIEFRMAVLNQEGDLAKAYLADVADARNRDIEVRKLTGGQNIRADLAVLAVIVGLIACLWVLMQYKSQMPGEVVGILSTIAGIFGACLKDYFAFEFGSSRSSRQKDEIISQLTK